MECVRRRSATAINRRLSPFGTKPNYTDMQQISFDNAGEKAFGASVAYDFGYAFGDRGLTGLSVGIWDTQGWGAINPSSGMPIADRNELDLWAQYRPTRAAAGLAGQGAIFRPLAGRQYPQPAAGAALYRRLYGAVPAADQVARFPPVWRVSRFA